MSDYKLSLSQKDVKQITGWSRSTVYNLIKAGTLPVVKLPKYLDQNQQEKTGLNLSMERY